MTAPPKPRLFEIVIRVAVYDPDLTPEQVGAEVCAALGVPKPSPDLRVVGAWKVEAPE